MTINALALILIKENDEGSDNSEYVTVVEGWIDDAIDEVANFYEWKLFKRTDTINTVASTASYELSADVKDIRSIRFVDTDEPIDYVDEQRLAGIAENLENEGKPRFWYYGPTSDLGTDVPLKSINLVPIPDAIYELEANVNIHPSSAVLANTVSIPFQKESILAIKNRVRAYMLMDDKDYEGAKIYLQMFYKQMEDMKAKEIGNPSAKFLVMQPRDLGTQSDRRFARLDPSHFRN